LLILFSHVLELLTGVGNDNNSSADLPGKLGQLFVTLLNLLVKRLVLDLKLFEINQVESISQLLFFLEDLLAVSQLIAELNVLQAVLMHFRILGFVSSFPVVDHTGAQGFVGATEDSILGNGTLQLFELMLDLFALSLLLVKLGLKFRGHSVVTLLGLFEVKSNLMDVS